MSDEEKRLKLEKMSENAKWRDGVRNKNVSKHKHDNRKEEEEERGGSRSAASSEIFKYFQLISNPISIYISFSLF